jgi:hypothetical protein
MAAPAAGKQWAAMTSDEKLDFLLHGASAWIGPLNLKKYRCKPCPREFGQ